AEMVSPQCRHLPLRKSQESSGTLSRGATGVSQLGQCERGLTSDCPIGSRYTTTFRKLPMTAPEIPAKAVSIVLTGSSSESGCGFSPAAPPGVRGGPRCSPARALPTPARPAAGGTGAGTAHETAYAGFLGLERRAGLW